MINTVTWEPSKCKPTSQAHWSSMQSLDLVVAQLVTSLTADLGVAGLIPAQSHTFVEIDHEIISMVILLPTLIQEGLLSPDEVGGI